MGWNWKRVSDSPNDSEVHFNVLKLLASFGRWKVVIVCRKSRTKRQPKNKLKKAKNKGNRWLYIRGRESTRCNFQMRYSLQKYKYDLQMFWEMFFFYSTQSAILRWISKKKKRFFQIPACLEFGQWNYRLWCEQQNAQPDAQDAHRLVKSFPSPFPLHRVWMLAIHLDTITEHVNHALTLSLPSSKSTFSQPS